MRRGVPAFLLLLALPILSAGAPAAPQSTDCATWSECRALVEEAIATGAFQQAHDLAWRAVQLGPKDDADLMFLLARAQSLAGRPHDALVMVRRLAERGIATGSETHPDLVRMRALPGWPDVQALVASASASASADHTAVASPRPGNALAPGSPDGLAVSGKKSEPSVSSSGTAADPASPKTAAVEAGAAGFAEQPVRFSSDRFVTAGLAYDAVSHRFLVGDRDGRKVRVVGEGLDEAVDLVRAESAGFSSIRALAIDPRRGDLWVVSADTDTDTAALHWLQLVSGRPLKAFALDGGTVPPNPIDLAVTAAGDVLVLDRDGRLARFNRGAGSIEAPIELGVAGATSVATGASDARVFVAHRDGIALVDLSRRTVTALRAPDGVSLAGFLRLRAYPRGLVGLQSADDGQAHLVRLGLSTNARDVRTATV
ncbi:MAG: hypothetical protein OEW19_14110, partial [Acidobacteriota bacterium]|nr:hypothetical protein [Acidobacteriota bacterium]